MSVQVRSVPVGVIVEATVFAVVTAALVLRFHPAASTDICCTLPAWGSVASAPLPAAFNAPTSPELE
jgi:hypothetical protein